jgi:hypothetical protein
MVGSTFDRETLLDITVNVIPLFILAFFIVLFVVRKPWSGEPLIYAMSHVLTIVPFVLLALLTYIAAREI